MAWKKGQSGNPQGARIAPHMPRTSDELDVRKLAQKFTRGAIATAASIMHNRLNQPQVRLAAADLLMKRGHGNPITPISNPDLTPLDFSEMDDAKLNTAVERLEQAIELAKGPRIPESREGQTLRH